MKAYRIAAVLVFGLIFSAVSFSQAAPGDNSGNSGDQQGKFMAASTSLKILSPTVDEKIGASSVSVRYQLTNTGADPAPSPTFRVQLDSRDPSETLDTEYSFTGLAPGAHVVTVELVDANHTPVSGSQAVVHFKVMDTAAPTTSIPQSTGTLVAPAIVNAKMSLPDPIPAEQLPSAGGELPLLSMVGFGVLVGGVLSAMRTRR